MPGPTFRLTRDDLDYLGGQFADGGFAGVLNPELLAPWADATVTVPALYIVGDRYLVLDPLGGLVENLERFVPGLKRKIVLPGCGHWTQQERPAEVNAALTQFLKECLESTLER